MAYSIYDNFEAYCSNIACHAVEFYEKGDDELIIRLDDGRMISYYDPERSIRTLSNEPSNMTELEFRREFSRRLRRKMWEKGINQMTLALEARISEVSLSHYMTGKSTPSFYVIDKIAKVLRCSVDDLRYDSERYGF